MWKHYKIVETEEQLLKYLAENDGHTKIISGGTDLMIEIRNGKREDVDTLLDISRMQGLDRIWRDEDGLIHVEALVTHNDVLRSSLLREFAAPLYQACSWVATPQIRNMGTVVGNVVTGSPANDTIPALLAMGASVLLASASAERLVLLENFYTGIRRTVLKPDEFLKEIVIPELGVNAVGVFKKSALRRAQAISVLNCCVLLKFKNQVICDATITLGSVAPTVIHAENAEAFLVGKRLDKSIIGEASSLAAQAAKPISDVRASDEYRRYMLGQLVTEGLSEIWDGSGKDKLPVSYPTLDTHEGHTSDPAKDWDGHNIRTRINGQEYVLDNASDLTLANMLREKIGLMGTKIGCEEGECGACTLFMDGKAVVSCIVPAPRAHNASITTIEGISRDGELHPVQQAFIDHSAVQCGYCTPGFVMSAVKLLQEIPAPDHETILRGISGNLCRCTGYYKIVEAIEAASLKMER